ncbi:unnamed protein product [Pseudo-nitzschia multistriata]|uniref:DUF6824 domain-containing protein n=1 Tax=Pseudo-nitzschia multistriata TaxID=183589 RepID=A0A448ZPX4_9STRA|nr:unnamed protein product [Pseudo-nitzschia multistriata]VEU44089.1 unnamed protein product [Pseudo-nitzschia multistriata]
MFAAIGRDSNGEIIDGGHQENKDIGESYAGVMAAVRENLSKFVECPRHEDCLFGKGRPAMNHPGNIAMRRLVKNKLSQFISNNAKEKSEIVQECIDEIKEWNGRFLKEDSDHAGVFVIADNETVFKKIASAFRDLKKKQLREQQREKESVRDDPGNESTGEEVGRPSQSRVKGTKRPADQEFQSSENGASSISNGNRGVNSAMAMKTYTATNDASLMTNAETDDNGSCFSHLAQRKKTRNRCFYD